MSVSHLHLNAISKKFGTSQHSFGQKADSTKYDTAHKTVAVMLEPYLDWINDSRKRNGERRNWIEGENENSEEKKTERWRQSYEEAEWLCPWVNIGFADIVFMNEASDKRGWWDSWFNLLTSLTEAISSIYDEKKNTQNVH